MQEDARIPVPRSKETTAGRLSAKDLRGRTPPRYTEALRENYTRSSRAWPKPFHGSDRKRVRALAVCPSGAECRRWTQKRADHCPGTGSSEPSSILLKVQQKQFRHGFRHKGFLPLSLRGNLEGWVRRGSRCWHSAL